MTTSAATASLDMTETLIERNETAAELLSRMTDGRSTDGPGFRALVRRLAELNKHLANQGYNGTSN
jgi:hypothetical protein